MNNTNELFFVKNYAFRHAVSRHACKCLPHLSRSLWLRGYMVRYQSEAREAAYECTNCKAVETFTERAKPAPRNGASPRQQRALDKIKSYFAGKLPVEVSTLKQFETKQEQTGGLAGCFWVTVNTTGTFPENSGGYFLVGKSGKITVLSSYDYTEDSHRRAKHHAYMLGGVISRELKARRKRTGHETINAALAAA